MHVLVKYKLIRSILWFLWIPLKHYMLVLYVTFLETSLLVTHTLLVKSVSH